MKKHLRSILMTIMAMVVSLAVHAQQDVTSTYLVNPGFEQGPSFFHDASVVINGWNITGENLGDAFLNQNDGTAAPELANVFGVWAPSNVGDFEIFQTVKNLPAGTYSISCVMTTYKLEYTTQRFFVTSTSGGTKSLYYQSASLDTVEGESYSYAGYPDDGNGNGPFRLMKLKIKVAAGDSLAFGIRSNGTLSKLCPGLSTLGKNGHFKVDDFRLNFIADDVAYTKGLIQGKVDLIKEIRTDTLPGGYIQVVADKIAWGDKEIAQQTNQDSLDLCLVNLTNFISDMGIAKTNYLNLVAIIQTYEKLVAEWVFSGKDILDAAYEAAVNVLFSPNALNADFVKQHADLKEAIRVYSEGRIPENLISKATITASFTSGWENIAGIKDGYEPKNSKDKNGMAYGNWDGSNGKTNWVQFEWPTYMNFNRFDIYWWYDGSTPSNGGITQPLWSKLEYNVNGAWVLASANDTAVNKWNKIPLSIKTNKLRISMAGTVATGILEVKTMGLGKSTPDVSDYKMLIGDELVTINALNQDSLPKGYAVPTQTLKDQSAALLTGTDSIGLMNNYTALKAHRILLEAATVSFKNLNKTLATASTAATSSTHEILKPRLQALYDSGLAILTSNASLKDTIDKTNTALTYYLALNPTLVSAKTALDASAIPAQKARLQSLYDDGLAVFTSPTTLAATVNTTNTFVKACLTFNTTLANAKAALDASTAAAVTTKLQSLYDAGLATFTSPTSLVAAINANNTTLNLYLTFNTTLKSAKTAIDASLITAMKTKLQTVYDNAVTTFTAATNTDAAITAANTLLNNYVLANTRLVSTKASLDKTTKATRTASYQFAFDRAVTAFTAEKSDSVVFYTTSLYATQRLADTLATAETLMAQTWYVPMESLKGIYDASLATFVSNTNVAATLNTARTNLSAALLNYYTVNPAPVAIGSVKQNNFVNVYPTNVKRGSMINIDFSKELAKPAPVEMYMVSGQRVMKTNVVDQSSTVMVPSSLASGIYLMVFDSPEGKTFKKIVVE